ncbi:MAG TPA: cation-transporting P-type ATPase [Candidatus Binataceae bacterium]|nr:cation-transporting P-type ATPase [Candidatus Binataceae bacterium]
MAQGAAALSFVAADEAKSKSTDDIFSELDSSPQGLSEKEAEERLVRYGPNEIAEKRANPFLKFLG